MRRGSKLSLADLMFIVTNSVWVIILRGRNEIVDKHRVAFLELFAEAFAGKFYAFM